MPAAVLVIAVQHFGSMYNMEGIILVKLCITDKVLTTHFVFSKSRTGILAVTFCGAL